MYLNVRHLRCLLAVHETGSLSRAAQRLHLTQSALSHQIKAIEHHFDVPLFLRTSKPLRLTPAGQKVVALAQQLLPQIQAAENDLKRLSQGQAGRLYIAIECHACFEWLRPVLGNYRRRWPDVEVDIRLDVSFNPIPALQRGEVDLVVTSDVVALADLRFERLCDYQALLACAPSHPLAAKDFIEPADLAGETLITYPVDRERLDVFTRFLQPAGIEPATVRQSELTAIILLLVASQRGVAVLPDWVLSDASQSGLAARPLGVEGLFGTLHAAIRKDDGKAPFMSEFIAIAREYHQARTAPHSAAGKPEGDSESP
ncbi:MAG: LysR family transcriptional regulator [Porticoccaceae bacterium]